MEQTAMALFSQVRNLVELIYRTVGQPIFSRKYLTVISLSSLDMPQTTPLFYICSKHLIKRLVSLTAFTHFNRVWRTRQPEDGGIKVLKPFHILKMMATEPSGKLYRHGQKGPRRQINGSNRL